MVKNKNTIFVIIAVLLVGALVGHSLGLFSITGSETMSMSAPSIVDPGQTFSVTYTASGVNGAWAASVLSLLDCGSYGTQQKQFVMISDEGTTKTIQYTAPNVEGITCTWQGGAQNNYQYGSSSIRNFPTQTIQTRVTTISHNSFQCYDNDVYWYNSKNVLEDKKQECGVAGCANNACRVCAIDIAYDTDCNGQISRTELGTIINQWINGQVTRDVLGQVIQKWANS